MSNEQSEEKITKEQIELLAAELDEARTELNLRGGELRTVSEDLLALSKRLDDLVVKHMKLTKLYKQQGD